MKRQDTEEQKLALRRKYYLDSDEKIILFVGRLDRVKGINSLLSSFQLVLEQMTNIKLVIIGAGDIIPL